MLCKTSAISLHSSWLSYSGSQESKFSVLTHVLVYGGIQGSVDLFAGLTYPLSAAAPFPAWSLINVNKYTSTYDLQLACC